MRKYLLTPLSLLRRLLLVPVITITLKPKKMLKYERLVESMPSFVFILDKNGILLYVNPHCRYVLGYSPVELTGKPFESIVAVSDQAKLQKSISNFRSKKPVKRQLHFTRKNGTEIKAEWQGHWDDEAKLWYCHSQPLETRALHADLQNEYEKKVKEYNKRLSSILDRIGEGFVALDEEGRVIYWNRQAELISGKPREEVLAQRIWDCYPEMTTQEFCSFYNTAIVKQVHQQYEAFYPKENKWIEIVLHPGDIGITAFFRDISEQKKIETELETQKKEMKKKLNAAVIQAQERERNQISMELHDNVNQVLTTVKLYIELCANDQGNKDLMLKSISLLQACIDEIRSLSKQLSAPSLGKIGLRDSVKDLMKTMMAAGKTKIQLNTKGIKDVKVSQELHLAIYRILQEHLTNIVKHANAKDIRIVINYLDDDIILKVTDNGRGFNLQEMVKGIGIDNMTLRAESLGGKLTINSAPGLGCVLIVQFPAGAVY